MLKNAIKSTFSILRKFLVNIALIIFSIIAGLIATYFDFLELRKNLDLSIVILLYSVICIIAFFLFLFIINIIINIGKSVKIRIILSKVDTRRIHIAEGSLSEPIWIESEDHSLTIINDTGQIITSCFILLDEIYWKNTSGVWEIQGREIFSHPFIWQENSNKEGKREIGIDERASFYFISHREYSVYNVKKGINERDTDFTLLFFGSDYIQIGYGPDIRLIMSIRGMDKNKKPFKPIKYKIDIHLLRIHGIPKVKVINVERIEQ